MYIWRADINFKYQIGLRVGKCQPKITLCLGNSCRFLVDFLPCHLNCSMRTHKSFVQCKAAEFFLHGLLLCGYLGMKVIIVMSSSAGAGTSKDQTNYIRLKDGGKNETNLSTDIIICISSK